MSAVMSRPAADFSDATEQRTVDELDAAIGRLVLQMNADSYRMLVLVREFDDRFAWKKWSSSFTPMRKPSAERGTGGPSDRHREAAAVRLQSPHGHRGRERQSARRRAKTAYSINAVTARALRSRAGARSPGCHRKRYLDGHHLKHWINGGETAPGNMTLLCTYHHTMLHEGGFSIAKEADDVLRFITADGWTIPRGGYRLEDFVDDDVGGADENPSREGFCTTRVQPHFERSEIRETAAIYQLRRAITD